jgi:hypothetical protein
LAFTADACAQVKLEAATKAAAASTVFKRRPKGRNTSCLTILLRMHPRAVRQRKGSANLQRIADHYCQQSDAHTLTPPCPAPHVAGLAG